MVGCPIQHSHRRATVECWMSLGPCAWGGFGWRCLGRRAFVWRSLGPNPLPFVMVAGRPNCGAALGVLSRRRRLDSRLDGTRLGSTRLETFRPQTRRAPLVFSLVVEKSLASRRRRPDFDMSSFIFSQCCPGKKETKNQDKQRNLPPRVSLSPKSA